MMPMEAAMRRPPMSGGHPWIIKEMANEMIAVPMMMEVPNICAIASICSRSSWTGRFTHLPASGRVSITAPNTPRGAKQKTRAAQMTEAMPVPNAAKIRTVNRAGTAMEIASASLVVASIPHLLIDW